MISPNENSDDRNSQNETGRYTSQSRIDDSHYNSPSMNPTPGFDMGQLAEHSLDKIRSLARQKPVAVVATGVALGLVTGWLLKRK